MFVTNYKEISLQIVEQGARNTTIRWLISENNGANNFHMRLFEIGPDGSTPHHSHPWEHEFFILEGEGKLVGEDTSTPLKPGDAGFVTPDEIHHFESSEGFRLKMLCIIPSGNL